MNQDFHKLASHINRRQFLTKTSLGLGALALGNLLNAQPSVAPQHIGNLSKGGLPGLPHFTPKA
ncbi:MAG: twin-arginine translocation signal domain-containing protein, partial [Bacteroidota bacterium]